jgi:electron transport protein HydN
MPIQCHHCEDAPCVKSCLTKALERIDGVVVINKRRCIGCRNCSIACPFGAIEIIADAESTVYKCDLCLGEKEQACVSACPNKALRLVEPNDEILAKRKNALNAFSEEGVR